MDSEFLVNYIVDSTKVTSHRFVISCIEQSELTLLDIDNIDILYIIIYVIR